MFKMASYCECFTAVLSLPLYLTYADRNVRNNFLVIEYKYKFQDYEYPNYIFYIIIIYDTLLIFTINCSYKFNFN